MVRSRRSIKSEAVLAQQASNGLPHDQQEQVSASHYIESQLVDIPIGKEKIDTIRHLVSEKELQDQWIVQAITFLGEAAEGLAEVDPDNTEGLDSLDQDVKKMIDLQAESDARKHALHQLKSNLESGNHVYTPHLDYQTLVQEQLDLYESKTTRQKYAQNQLYVNYRSQIWSTTNDGAMPPITNFIPAEEGDDADSDEEIEAGGVTQNYRCPLSARTLEDPVTSTRCNHSYSAMHIKEYLRNGGDTCPVSGCKARISESIIKTDPPLKKRVAAYLRREEERALQRRNASTSILN